MKTSVTDKEIIEHAKEHGLSRWKPVLHVPLTDLRRGVHVVATCRVLPNGEVTVERTANT